jgi:nucleoside-diphosphate-sugar epimerase
VLGPGAHSRTSPWRSEVFEKIGLPYGAEVTIPYRGDETLPLVHVEDVADMLECLVGAKETSYSVYNALSEAWELSQLAAFMRSLDDNLCITFGDAIASGGPRVIDSQRFAGEFGYAPVSLKERLCRAARCRLVQAN